MDDISEPRPESVLDEVVRRAVALGVGSVIAGGIASDPSLTPQARHHQTRRANACGQVRIAAGSRRDDHQKACLRHIHCDVAGRL